MARPDDIIVIGGSAGSLEVLIEMVANLPRSLPAAVFVVVHVAPHGDSHLPSILSRSGPLPAKHANDGDTIEVGRIYVAPPDRHLLVEPDGVRLTRGPRENHHRPAIDPLFRSAAETFGARVIGVLLSGALDDGVAGLLEIKRAGGIVVVQDPRDALIPSMPRRALEQMQVDHVVAQGSLAPLLTRLVEASKARLVDPEKKAAAAASSSPAGDGEETGRTYSCPECGGTLVETRTGELYRYSFHEGHVLSSDSFLGAQSDQLQAALWTALRTLDERAELAEKFAAHARAKGQTALESMFTLRAKDARARAALVRQAVERKDDGEDAEALYGEGERSPIPLGRGSS